MVASLSPTYLYTNSPGGRRSTRNQIHIPNQPAVEKYIRFYTEEGRRTFQDSMDRSKPFVPVMCDILQANNVPIELLSIVFVESGFNRQASYRGAVGYWQMLASTARTMGLRVDRWVDERRDPVKSTQAAAKYLRRLYEQFESWPLALAAYNAGDRPVTNAVRRCGASDFFQLSRRGVLPGRTRVYVPKVLAAMRIMRDPEAHGFKTPVNFAVYDFEAISVNAPLKLEQVARWIQVPVAYLKDLNPALRQDRLPPDCGVPLNLPSGARDKFDIAYQGFLRN
jgi:membrane-bound lytic murein transglycosylase D